MTKQEKIQEAYRQYWELAKDYVDENGWVKTKDIKYIDLIGNDFFDTKSKFFTDIKQNDTVLTFIRPKSLQGIKTNNGWTEYNLNIDLDGGYYHLIISGECRIDYFSPTSKTFEVWSKHAVTHYQPITKPKPPIY